MLKFNELRITKDKHLIIDFQILDSTLPHYDSISIDNIYVGVGTKEYLLDYMDYWAAGIGPNCTFEWKDDEEATVKASPSDEEETVTAHRGFRLNIDLSDTWTDGGTYTVNEAYKRLVYVKIKVVAEDYRVELDNCMTNNTAEAFAYDRCFIVDTVFDYIKSTDNPCTDLSNYANYIVQIKGLEIAIESGNFTLANKFWNKFFFNNRTSVTSNCCCR